MGAFVTAADMLREGIRVRRDHRRDHCEVCHINTKRWLLRGCSKIVIDILKSWNSKLTVLCRLYVHGVSG